MLPLLLFATTLAAKHSIKVESCLRALEPELDKCKSVEEKCRVLAKEGSQCLSDAKPEHLIELMHSLDNGACLQYNLIDWHLSKRDESESESEPGSAAAAPEHEHARDLNLVNQVIKWAKERQAEIFDTSEATETVPMSAAYSDKYAPVHDRSGLSASHLPGIICAAGVILAWILL